MPAIPPAIGPFTAANPFILAPMAGVSEKPFRLLALRHGAGLAPTELISAKGLEHGNRRTREYLDHGKEEHPFWVQLFGGDPEGMAVAALKAVEAGAHMLDINMGCPVKKVTKTGAGSALLCDPSRGALIVEAMRRAVGDAVPVTVKIRAGWDAAHINCVDVARTLESAGAAAVALHARTRAQGYSGVADWGLIRQLKESVRIPVIGNGDVRTAADARRMLRETGCDFVMVGRGALGNPWLFNSLCAGVDLPPPSPDARWAVVEQHLQAHLEFTGNAERAVRQFRQHLIWYSRGLRGSAQFRERAMALGTPQEVLEACRRFFCEAEAAAEGPHGDDDGVNYDAALG